MAMQRFESDAWRIKDTDPYSQNYGTTYLFDFSFLTVPGLKPILMEYIHMNHIAGNRTVRSLRELLLKFKHFNGFAKSECLENIINLDAQVIDRFRSYLAATISGHSGKAFSYSYQKNCYDALKSVIVWAQINMPDCVTTKELFLSGAYRGVNKQLKIDFIPDDVIAQINTALSCEDNLYLRYGLIILETTGIRIGDLLLLEVDCLGDHPVDGHTLTLYDHKRRKERLHLPIPAECASAILSLLEVTKEVREKADQDIKQLLFIYAPTKGTNKKAIVKISRQTYTKWINRFAERHAITDSGGNIYNITAHAFRRTLATDMLSKGTNIKAIQEALFHASVTATKCYYADVKDAERVEMFSKIGIIGALSQINESILSEQDRRWLLDNANGKARLSDGYCTDPFESGSICERLKRRRRCYSCSRYITTLEDLPYHREHLKELYEEMHSNPYGEHYAAHIRPLIETLEEIITRLEVLENE
jgi:integrase